jgi:ribulose 1,5-bisphosphate synthetase/thiazole synthase
VLTEDKTMRSVLEPARQIPVVDDVDVLVVGGGPAGMHAAIAAARQGARTALVERYGFMGGNATNALVGPILGLYHYGTGRVILGGTPREMLERMGALGGALLNEPGFYVPFDPEVMKYVADRMVGEAGVRLRLHSFACGVIMDGPRIAAVIVESKSGRQAIAARVVVDCTGDGDIAAQAGAPYEVGQPGDGALQPMTLSYRLGNVDLSKMEDIHNRDQGYVVTNVREVMERAVAAGKLPVFGGPWIMNGSTVRDGEAFVNMVRLWGDATDVEVLTRSEVTGRDHIQQFVRFLRENIDGLQGVFVMDSGAQIGVRETRRFLGDYVLSEEDITSARGFDDTVAMGGHVIDIHSPSGTAGQRRDVIPAYQIPYRCLLPKGVENLLVAGRPISASHEAHASLRVMGTCMGIGQGAGVGAALAARSDGNPRRVDVAVLRRTLEAIGAVTK